MIENLKPYPEYKDSGLPWLREVPAHWEIARSKRLFKQRKDFAQPDDQQLSATQAYGVIPQALYEKRTGYRVVKISMHLDKRKHVEADDFVISMRSFQGGLERAWASGAIRSSYVVLKPIADVVPGYFQYLFKSHQYINALRATSDFIRDGQDLNFGNFCGVDLPIIPLQEQAAIARFLAWATNRLDRAIGAKRRIIALLQEQKQAIIHRAVTRGLDPSVPLKDSGIPWLGEIPEHWEVRRAKYLFREVDRRSETGAETHLAMSQRLGLVPSSMVQSTLRSQSYAGGKLCSSGDLVLNRLKAHLGVFAIAKQDGVISPDYTVLREQALAHADYYACILKSPGCRGELQTRAKGIVEGFWRLYTGDFYEIRLPTPPIDEQLQIMDLASQQTRDQDAAISRLESEITLLREYRTRLVADVVTGKLDVREVAAGLPEEIQSDDVQDATEEDLDLDAEDEVPENLA